VHPCAPDFSAGLTRAKSKGFRPSSLSDHRISHELVPTAVDRAAGTPLDTPNDPIIPGVLLSAHGTTHPGRRASNEDALLVDQALGLFVVADGMGGHKAGEVAARLAIDAIQEFIGQSRNGAELTWPHGLDPELSVDANRLRTAVRLANSRVLEASEARSEYTGMGTTVVAALAGENRLVFVGVGDSRVYLWQRGRLQQLTQDDSWVATVLAREPGMTDLALAQHPMRHVLTSVIGARADTEPDVEERAFERGDVVLLCSDGLHGAMDLTETTSLLGSHDGVADMSDALVRRALARGASDNVTAVVIRREG
jgi:PPM family protein phosphatase